MQRQRRPKKSPQPNPRLQKVLALAGYGSRRACEQLITDGRVEVDREIVIKLGTRVDAESQQIKVDGEVIRLPEYRYFAINKPVGVVTTNRDPARRMRVVDLVPGGEQMFAVGRLDKASSGLIIVTNDGEFANKLAHPRYGIEKTYRVVVSGHPSPETLGKLRRGVHLAEGKVRVAGLRVKARNKNQTVLQIVLDEGRNREIRRMLAQVGHKVVALQRTAIGSLKLGAMPEGAHRAITKREIQQLFSVATKSTRRSGRKPAQSKDKPPTAGRGTKRNGTRRKGARSATARASRSSRR